MHHEPIELDQDVLRRRLRAARILANCTVEQLAERVTPGARLSQRTLHKLEQGDTPLTAPIMRELASALDLPYEWFTVPSIGRAIRLSIGQPDAHDRIDEMQAQIDLQMERVWAELKKRDREDKPGEGRHLPPESDGPQGHARRPRSPRRAQQP